jgi:malate permease and related proteins
MLIEILYKITLPVFILIGIGILADRTLQINLPTLTRLNYTVFLPALVFIKTLDAGLTPAIFGSVTLINLIHTAILFGAAWAIFSLPALRSSRPVLTLSALLPNAGNYGIPLATLAFGAVGANVMAIIVMLQIIVTVTLGLLIINSGKAHWKEVLLTIVKTPALWAVILPLLLITLNLRLPFPLRSALDYLSNGLVPVALITLGVQLSRSRFGGKLGVLSLVSIVRLIISPALALLIVWGWQTLLHTDLGVAGPVLVIGAGMPAAINVFILAAEYGQDTDQASQAILWTTTLSALTLTIWLALLNAH